MWRSCLLQVNTQSAMTLTVVRQCANAEWGDTRSRHTAHSTRHHIRAGSARKVQLAVKIVPLNSHSKRKVRHRRFRKECEGTHDWHFRTRKSPECFCKPSGRTTGRVCGRVVVSVHNIKADTPHPRKQGSCRANTLTLRSIEMANPDSIWPAYHGYPTCDIAPETPAERVGVAQQEVVLVGETA